VLPNPPSPLKVSSKFSTSKISVGSIFSMMTCAILSCFLNLIPKLLDFKVLSSVIEQYHTDLSSVIFIDDPCADINRVLPSQTGSGSDSAVSVGRNHPAETSLNHGFTTSRHYSFLRGTNIITGSKYGSLFGNDSIFIEFLDKEFTYLLADLFGL
jgi:hypothetical protein